MGWRPVRACSKSSGQYNDAGVGAVPAACAFMAASCTLHISSALLSFKRAKGAS